MISGDIILQSHTSLFFSRLRKNMKTKLAKDFLVLNLFYLKKIKTINVSNFHLLWYRKIEVIIN